MDLFNLSYGDFEHFIFVLVRVGAFIVFVPILGSQQVPARVKIGFILLLSLSVFSLVREMPMPESRGLLDFTVYLFSEATVGLALAFATRLIFTVVQIAGTVVDFQMGFGIVNVIDPQTQSQVSITAQFQNIFAILLYLALNAHHLTIYSLVESFHLINPHHFGFSAGTMALIMKLFANTFVVAIKIAAPIMAILFFISIGLGLVARAVPQMNVFIVGFPLQIGAGLLMVGLTMSFFAMVMTQHISQLPHWLMGLMLTMGG
ncbi:MAG: flagellar biosynthetic protein FliR [Nitrospinae bacterium]|nr:flagellar biosynthetic protein FliR [Nitrospinota bacterium]